MESLVDVKVLIGALLITLVALYRFNVAPPHKPKLPDNTPRPLGVLAVMFRFKDEAPAYLFPPPRANTTYFKFFLYRAAYAAAGVLVYLVLYAIPGVAAEVDQFLSLVGTDSIPPLANGGPIIIALIVAFVFPVCPPLRAGERAIRRTLYDRACIPAQQFRERHRLKHAPYVVDPVTLGSVRDDLIFESFEVADLAVDDGPTTRSMWTKVAVLMAHIECWRSEDRYKTAFETLRDQDGLTRTVDTLGHAYKVLKPDARVCFKALREHTGEKETTAREDAFRQTCRDFLDSIYDFLSRVSLHSHYTDRERVIRMREVGFILSPSQSGPIPDPNDVAALSLLIAGVVFVPLSYHVGTPRAILISLEVYAAIVVPILLAARFPSFATPRPNGTPAIAFPLVAGLLAAAAGLVAHTLVLSYTPDGPSWFVLGRGWDRYANRSYPWSFLLLLLGALIAWRMRADAYPDASKLHGIGRIQQWGSVADAARFLVCTLALTWFYIRPKVAELSGDLSRADDWSLILLPAAITTVVGFFVPTWYRAHAAMARETTTSSPMPAVVAPSPARRQERVWQGP